MSQLLSHIVFFSRSKIISLAPEPLTVQQNHSSCSELVLITFSCSKIISLAVELLIVLFSCSIIIFLALELFIVFFLLHDHSFCFWATHCFPCCSVIIPIGQCILRVVKTCAKYDLMHENETDVEIVERKVEFWESFCGEDNALFKGEFLRKIFWNIIPTHINNWEILVDKV